MSSQSLALLIVAAVLVFWTVGAYNRLVGLRNALVRNFTPVDEQFRSRHALLLGLADALAPGSSETQPWDTLRAACVQAEAACTHARARPGNSGAITSLRMAEEILSQARTRLPAWPTDDDMLAALTADLSAGDTTLAFARRQFNDGVEAYNRAAGQFPTWVIARLFGFRKAGTL